MGDIDLRNIGGFAKRKKLNRGLTVNLIEEFKHN